MKGNLLILSRSFNLIRGGVSNTSNLMATEMQKYVNVFTMSPAENDAPEIENVRSFKSRYTSRNFLFSLDSVRTIFKIHRQYKIDYVLSTRFGYAFCCLFLKWFRGVPYGVMTHGQEVIKWKKSGILGTLRYLVSMPVRYLVLKNADNVFANTNFTKGLVEKIVSDKEVIIINPPLNFVKRSVPANFKKRHIMLSLSQLVERKGVQNVIKALPEIRKHVPDIKYIVAGEGPYGEKLHELVRAMNLQDIVSFKGSVSEEEKLRLFEECDFFIMPSITLKNDSIEGFGIVFMEANNIGKFVISTRSGGIPEAIEDGVTGFVIEENNIDEIVDAVLKFYSDDFTYSPKRCYEWASERSIENIARKYYATMKKYIPN